MIIEVQDAFRSWLSAILKPMCDADPAALAKYVIALIKKDKTEDELRKTMVQQLLVFLEDETVSFVNQVFQALESKEYITTPVIPSANPPNPNVTKTAKEPNINKEPKTIVPPNELTIPLTDSLNGSNKKEAEIKRDRDMKKPETLDKEEKPRRRSRHRSLSRNRSRSRSRSWDRTRRSRSPLDKNVREKSREREQHRIDREKRDRPRAWRNKSPPRRYTSRRSRTPSPNRNRSRSRSPRHGHRGRYRNRTPARSASKSRSRSPPEKRDRKDSGKDKEGKEHSRPGTPTQDSNHGDMDLRLTNSTQSVSRAVAPQNSKRRCRDFDERGYCMRGEMCPYDHGVDPVVLEDAALSRVLNFNPNGAPEVPPNVIPPPVLPGSGPPVIGPRVVPPEYNPQAPHMWRPGFRGPRPMGMPRLPQMGAFPPQPNMQRELIPIPVLDNKMHQDPYGMGPQQHPNFMHNPMDHHHDMAGGFKKKNFDFNRLGPRSKNPANCSLELKKVPTGLNSITHLNNHFAKFGKIVNIQVNYEGDPEAAIVTFSSHAEANAAYRSTEAVLNNRFIKVFWHNNNNEGKQENVPPRSVKERLGVNSAVVVPNSNKVLNLVQPRADNAANPAPPGEQQPQSQDENSDSNSEVKPLNKEETKAQAVSAIKKGQELLAAKEKLKKNQEEKKKEVLKISQNLRKKKQELLEKQLSQQKILIEKMEKSPAGQQRDLLKTTIKKMQESIEAIKKDIEKTAMSPKSNVPNRKTKEEAQKEVLDAELDLIAKQQEGLDTTELQKKILELKAKANMVGTPGVRGRASLRGRRFTPVSRHLLKKNNLVSNPAASKASLKTVNKNAAPFQKHTIDHRPTRLLVSGYETDEQEGVLTHFQQYGEIVDYVVDSSLPSVVFNYKSRKEAEMALLKGKHFQDRTLSVTWCNNVQMNNPMSRSSSRTVLVSESEEEHLMDENLLETTDDAMGTEMSEEALLQDDEEEEEENEDRSWRR